MRIKITITEFITKNHIDSMMPLVLLNPDYKDSDFVEHYKDDLVSEAIYNAKEWVKRNQEKLNSIGV